MSENTPLRRIPQQARSQRRVKHILDTAEQLFVEAGYEQTSTNAIAARAGVPIGSLYQFFPSKEAILNALIERNTEQLRALFEDHALDDLPLQEAVGQLVERLMSYDQTHGGFKMMLVTSGIVYSMYEEIVQFVGNLIARRVPELNPERCRLAAMVAFTIVKGLMQLSGPPYNLPSEHVLREVKTALIAYLDAMLQTEGISIRAK